MRKIQLGCFALMLAAGIAHAGTPCNGFEVKIKNKTPDDLLVNKIELVGANIQPGGIQKLNAKSEQVFTVNNSGKNTTLLGKLEFHSISLPSKKVVINFDLKNKHLICHHHDKGSGGDYKVKHTRLPGHVNYTIG